MAPIHVSCQVKLTTEENLHKRFNRQTNGASILKPGNVAQCDLKGLAHVLVEMTAWFLLKAMWFCIFLR